MEIKLGNVLAMFLFIVAIGVFVKMKPEILYSLSMIAKTVPGHPPSERLNGCLALAIICVTLLGALRLIIAERRK